MWSKLTNENKKNTVFLYIFTVIFLASVLLNLSYVGIVSHDYIVYGLVIGILGIIIVCFRFDYKKNYEISSIVNHIHICSVILVFSTYLYFEHLITFIVLATVILLVNWTLFLLGKASKYKLSAEEFKKLRNNMFPGMYLPVVGIPLVQRLYKNHTIGNKISFIIFTSLILLTMFLTYKEFNKIIKESH